MGYTLVTAFDDSFYQKMDKIMQNRETNKIPFGRDCNRFLADQILKYHMTILHWGKQYDETYLPRVNKIPFMPFTLEITGTRLMYAEEGSLLLYFSAVPADGYQQAMDLIERTMEMKVSSFLHITLAVSQNHQDIENLKEYVDHQFTYPFRLAVTGLDLYHIWKPVKLASHIDAS